MTPFHGGFGNIGPLSMIDSPSALRELPAAALPALAHAIRRQLIETIGEVGGHFAASLGTVELTLALHRVYDTPHDVLVWDIGHQAYAHKLITGRGARLATIRRTGGLAPFLDRSESPFDAFGGGHAGTALSAAAGFAAAARLSGSGQRVAAVIGDGGLTAGMAFEALNHIGALQLDLLAICNDNDWSISANVGALRETVARQLGRPSLVAGSGAGAVDSPGDSHVPGSASDTVELPAASLAAFVGALGFGYHGPVDGHDLNLLLPLLARLRMLPGPQFLHVVTVKGKGHAPAEADPVGYHGVTRLDALTGTLAASSPAASGSASPTYSAVFGDWLCAAAAADPRVVAITPAMCEGSGLTTFAERFPERFFDVGIAEQHAVTLAAGMAAAGMRPVVAIYSTFLQRALDQLIHDVALQNLPVLFAIDRGGLVGADGATHHGAFDLSLLRTIPNLVVMAPSSGAECRQMLALGLAHDGPAAVRYPRGAPHGCTDLLADLAGDASSIGAALKDGEHAADAPPMLGRGRVLRHGARPDDGRELGREPGQERGARQPRVAILAFGSLVATALEAAGQLDATVADARFIKPLDADLIGALATEHDLLVTLEDNVVAGGAGGAVAELLAASGRRIPLLNLGLPDRFVAHGSRSDQLADCGLDAAGVRRAISVRLAQQEP